MSQVVEIPVESVKRGMTVVLQSGLRVTVDKLDKYHESGETVYYVRWSRPAMRGEPGFESRGKRYTASLKIMRAGDLVRVEGPVAV